GQHDVERHGVVPLRVSHQQIERGLAVADRLDLVTLGLEIEFQAVGQMLFVFNDQNNTHHFSMRGSSIVKILPIPSPSLSAKVLPPCLPTMERTMKSPSPAPLTRVATRLGAR